MRDTQEPIQTVTRQQPQQQVDLWGSTNQSEQKNDLDFFASMAAPAPAQSYQPDPFGFPAPTGSQQVNMFAALPMNNANPFGGNMSFSTSTTNFQQASTSVAGNFGMPQQPNQQFGSNPVFAQSTPTFSAGPTMGTPVMGRQSPFNMPTNPVPMSAGAQSGFGQSNATFDAAFDTGAGQKNLVPRYIQGQANPNAQLAQIARNAAQIDPFANLANTSSGTQGSQPGKGSMSDLFSSNANNTTSNPWGGSSSSPAPAFMGNAPLNPTPVFSSPQSTAMNPFSAFSSAPANTTTKPVASSGGADPFASLAPFPSKPPVQPSQPSGIGGQMTMNALAKQQSVGMGMGGGYSSGSNGMMNTAMSPMGQTSMGNMNGMGGMNTGMNQGMMGGMKPAGQSGGFGQQQPPNNNNFFF